MIDQKLEKIILSYPKLRDRIDGREEERDKALKNLNEIRADFNTSWTKNFARVLDVAIGKLYDGVLFDQGPIYDFKELVKDNNVVLVPNHQSHADYVALNYYVFKTFNFPLFVAGGINLNIFPIGTLFRKSGCFFIRRSFERKP